MAPHNSTFINQDVDLKSEHSEILSRFSPISKRSEDTIKKGGPISECGTDDNQDENEIPIWICGEPRFISGITNTTTCNDIIRALIDDEVQSGHVGSNDDVAASRDFRDYVITERWRDIEQALPGDTCVLPLWMAWGAARNEVKFKLKINKNRAGSGDDMDKHQHKNKVKPQQKDKVNLIRRLIRRIIKQGETIQDHLSELSENTFQRRGNSSSLRLKQPKVAKRDLLQTFLEDTTAFKEDDDDPQPEDEFLLVIENNEDDRDSGVHVHNTLPRNVKFQESHFYGSHDMLSIKETPRRKKKTPTAMDSLLHHNMNQNYFHPKLMNLQVSTAKKSANYNSMKNASEFTDHTIYTRISTEISKKTKEMNKLVDRKNYLMNYHTKISKKYKAENDLYRMKDGVDFSVDKVQHNLKKYTDDIVKMELELYRLRTEIQEKYSIITNLKRMLRTKEDNERLKTKQDFEFGPIKPVQLNMSSKFTQSFKNGDENMQFVDNIYEFCDNNASLVV